jgi:hypothetical protein
VEFGLLRADYRIRTLSSDRSERKTSRSHLTRRTAYLFDCRLKIPPDEGAIQFALVVDGNMANRLSCTSQNSVRVEKQRATVETEVHVSAVGDDVAKTILKWFAGEREPNRNCVASREGFNCARRLL